MANPYNATYADESQRRAREEKILKIRGYREWLDFEIETKRKAEEVKEAKEAKEVKEAKERMVKKYSNWLDEVERRDRNKKQSPSPCPIKGRFYGDGPRGWDHNKGLS
jgi:hypothetical protein